MAFGVLVREVYDSWEVGGQAEYHVSGVDGGFHVGSGRREER